MKAIFSLVLIFMLCSCNNQDSRSEKIIADFDSINKKLDAANNSTSHSAFALYDSIFNKEPQSSFRQFYYTVNDCKGYLQDLKRRFIIACGDATGTLIPEESIDKVSLTNDFFQGDGQGKFLVLQLTDVQKAFLTNTTDSTLKQRINSLTEVPFSKKKEGFMKTYFYNVPPVAAMTILSKFENDIENIEYRILKDYLNK